VFNTNPSLDTLVELRDLLPHPAQLAAHLLVVGRVRNSVR